MADLSFHKWGSEIPYFAISHVVYHFQRGMSVKSVKDMCEKQYTNNISFHLLHCNSHVRIPNKV